MSTAAETSLQLLLFVDRRPSSEERIRQICDCLNDLKTTCLFELQVIDVGEQPYLAEHFRLVATPALIKVHPEPRHTLAGNNLVAQLRHWWPLWQRSLDDYQSMLPAKPAVDTQRQDKVLQEPTAAPKPIEAAPKPYREPPPASLPNWVSRSSDPAPVNPDAIRSITRSAELIQLSDEVFRLKRENEELQHQLKFQDQIIAMLAHDLRNPLTAASLALETLEMGHDVQEGWSNRLTPTLTAQLLKHARTQTRAIDHMVTDILQAARGGSAELRIQPQKLDLRQLCFDVLKDMQDRIQEKSQQVEKDIPSDLPLVLADGDRVRQVVTNLLDNAIKYTPISGTISISALHRTTQKIQVSVCDNGPGIPEENRQRIFEDRYRLKRDEAQEGYGIGLSLCQRIIRAHYGQIWVDTAEPQGSCFHFTLPVFRI